ncbi:hypothetical protein [Sediminibacillus halophilus]|uniref:hypothetical protein n=1 Tax=Sediminibacillus halophilus TaxID=482461 RepID=UPI0009433A1D|nr:hypothetical protein [Sediminibacillus halophilus]
MKNILPLILPTFLIVFGVTSYLTTELAVGALIILLIGMIVFLVELRYIRKGMPRYRTAVTLLTAGIVYLLFVVVEQYLYGKVFNYFFATVFAIGAGAIVNVLMRDEKGN